MSLIDARDREVLDFDTIRTRLAGLTHASKAYTRAAEIEPSTDFAQVRRLVAETAEMRALTRATGLSFARIADVDAALANVARGVPIAALELRAIADALSAAGYAARTIRESEHTPLLRERIAAFRAVPNVVTRIVDAIDERGAVLDRASPALGRLRRGIAGAQDDARERAAAILRSAKYARAVQDQIVTVRDGRFVVPIKAEFGGEVPGIVHDASSSGATLFVEPLEALETNNRLRSLRAQEEHEVARILAELSSLTGNEAQQIGVDIELYVELDLAYARAALAHRMNAVAPVLVDEALIDVHDGRHPLLDERAVAQSLRLDDEIRLLLISGPNMGGKTVALKMVGLFVTMAGCGMHVPAVGATIGRFTRIFTDIGDEQSIAQNASTFSAHLRRLAAIVDAADDRALILIDEIGAGTEPGAGAALAVAVLERFIRAGARCIATTHATELKLFGADHAHVRNASVRFDPATYAPTYQLDLGSPGQSLAFALARTMQLDPAVVERAEALLSSAERDYDRALAELADERTRATHERERLDRERGELHTLTQVAQRKAETADRERRELASRAEARLGEALRSFTAELERRSSQAGGRTRARVTPGQSGLLSRTLDEMRRDLGLDRTPQRTAQTVQPIGVGDRVTVVALDAEAVVAEDLGESALVTIGSMRMTVPKTDLQRRGGPALRPKRDPAAGEARITAAANALTQLDVRGQRYVEAEPKVDQWIDAAVLMGYSPLRLVHGKGSGLLGRGLQEYLRGHPGVTGVRYGNADEGGSGVTVFELR